MHSAPLATNAQTRGVLHQGELSSYLLPSPFNFSVHNLCWRAVQRVVGRAKSLYLCTGKGVCGSSLEDQERSSGNACSAGQREAARRAYCFKVTWERRARHWDTQSSKLPPSPFSLAHRRTRVCAIGTMGDSIQLQRAYITPGNGRLLLNDTGFPYNLLV